MLTGLGLSWLYVPVRLGDHLDEGVPVADLATARREWRDYLVMMERDLSPTAVIRAPEAHHEVDAILQGSVAYNDPWWPPRYVWAWTLRRHTGGLTRGLPSSNSEWVSWDLVAAENLLIVLLGGGLLTFVVRRERRRNSASAEA